MLPRGSSPNSSQRTEFVGAIESWDESAAEGCIVLDGDAANGTTVRFTKAACGVPWAGGCAPRVGLRVRVACFSSDGTAEVVNPLGGPTHPSAKRPAPFRGTITEVRGEGRAAFGFVDGVGFFGRSCLGFEPEVGLEVWVFEYASGGPDARAQSLSLDEPPADLLARAADALRDQHAARLAAAEARRARDEKKARSVAGRKNRAAARALEYAARVVASSADGAAQSPPSLPDDLLLAAVLAAPDDDAPRRQLAARLLAQGDAYGAFIEAQLAAERDVARENELRARISKAWAPPRGAFRDAHFSRGFLADATLHADALLALEMRSDWRLGTLERLVVDKKSEKDPGWLAAYRQIVTAPAATALRQIDVRAIDDVERCPAFQNGRLRGVSNFPLFDADELARFEAPQFDWIDDVYVCAPDRQWPNVLPTLTKSEFFLRRPRRVHVWNRGCSYVDRRQVVVETWSSLPVAAISVWDIGLERTPAGTVARFGGWSSPASSTLIYPGIQMIDTFARHVPDLTRIETHGLAPPCEKYSERLARALPHVDVRHIFDERVGHVEGAHDF